MEPLSWPLGTTRRTHLDEDAVSSLQTVLRYETRQLQHQAMLLTNLCISHLFPCSFHFLCKALNKIPVCSIDACTSSERAGAFHSLSGPDHLAALAPLALRTSGPGKAFRTGAFWGFGHVLGQVLLGTTCFLLISQSQILRCGGFFMRLAEQFATVAVGVILMTGMIGGLGLKESRESWRQDLPMWHPDALLLCLPALTMPTRMAGLIFLTSFGAGSMLAMGGFTAALRAACKSLGNGRHCNTLLAFSFSFTFELIFFLDFLLNSLLMQSKRTSLRGEQAVRRTSTVASLLALLLGAGIICGTICTTLVF
eukprot:Skav209817  [mRNA]  locus=scaffold2424:43838:54211:+ [translate_table: standard]